MPDCPARLFRLFIVYQELTESFSSAASRRDEPAGGRDSCTTSSLSQIFQCSIFKTRPCRVAAASPFRKSPAKLRRKSEPAKFLTNFFQGTRTSGLRQAFTPPGPPPRVPSGKRVQNYAFQLSPPNFSSTFLSQFPQPSNIKHNKQTHNPLQYIILQQNGNAEFFCGNFIIKTYIANKTGLTTHRFILYFQ